MLTTNWLLCYFNAHYENDFLKIFICSTLRIKWNNIREAILENGLSSKLYNVALWTMHYAILIFANVMNKSESDFIGLFGTTFSICLLCTYKK